MDFSFPKLFTYECTITKINKGYKVEVYGLLGSFLVKIGVWDNLAQRTAKLIQEINTFSVDQQALQLQQLAESVRSILYYAKSNNALTGALKKIDQAISKVPLTPAVKQQQNEEMRKNP